MLHGGSYAVGNSKVLLKTIQSKGLSMLFTSCPASCYDKKKPLILTAHIITWHQSWI